MNRGSRILGRITSLHLALVSAEGKHQSVVGLRKCCPSEDQDLRTAITPMARWKCVRWVNATQNPDTRKRRVAVSISKMKSPKRRASYFNLAPCTDLNLSRNGRLRVICRSSTSSDISEEPRN